MPEMTHRPTDFSHDAPPERIIGVEMEYQAQTINDSRLQLSQSLEKSAFKTSDCSGFVDNGARIYQDCGEHIEYATPECRGSWQATAADLAGIHIMDSLTNLHAQNSDKDPLPTLRRTGIIDKDSGTIFTKGYHENFLTGIETGTPTAQILAQALTSHLVSRILWNGNGFVADRYLLSQKEPGIGVGAITGWGQRTNHGAKPAASLLANPDKVEPGWLLTEVRFADSHMSPWATFMGLATTSLVIRLVEQGVINSTNIEEFTYAKPMVVKDKLNKRLGADYRHETISGYRLGARCLQRKLANSALELAGRIKVPNEEVYAAQEWVKLGDDLGKIDPANEDFSAIHDRVEWAAKYNLIRKKVGGETIAYHNRRALAIDWQWDSLGQGSIGERFWRRKDRAYDQVETEAIAYLDQAPHTTRALARASLIAAQPKSRVDWGKVEYETGHKKLRRHKLTDPYNPILPLGADVEKA